MVAWPSREELNCWVTLQLAISGSGVLPLPHCFAAVGVPLGVACCVAVALLNDATTQWLLAAAAPLRLGERVARSYSDLAARANFSARTKLAVEASSAILLFGSLAACLAAVGENAARAVHTASGWRAAAEARVVAPAAAGLGAAAAGLRAFDDMAWTSGLGLLFLAALLLAVVGACAATLGDGGAPPLAPESWAELPSAVSTLGYSLYVGPIALSMVDDRPGRLGVVARATHACFLTTTLIYVVLGVAGASWLGRATPSDVSTAFSPGVRGGAWAANVVPGGTVLYLALATAPMLNPLRDSVAALAGREVADGAVTAAVLALVVLSVVLASTLESLLIFSLSGATGVCVTCYVVPVACLWSIPRDRDPKDYVGYRRSKAAFLRDVLGPGLALFFGVSFSALTVVLAVLQTAESVVIAGEASLGPEEG